MWRDVYKHMDVIGRQYAPDHPHSHLLTNLADHVADPFADCPAQDLVAVFGNPDNMIAVMKNRVTSGPVDHSQGTAEASSASRRRV